MSEKGTSCLLQACLWFSCWTVRAPWLLWLYFPELSKILRHWLASFLSSQVLVLAGHQVLGLLLHMHRLFPPHKGKVSRTLIPILQMTKWLTYIVNSRARIQTQDCVTQSLSSHTPFRCYCQAGLRQNKLPQEHRYHCPHCLGHCHPVITSAIICQLLSLCQVIALSLIIIIKEYCWTDSS